MSYYSMRDCDLQAWGGKGTLGENNLAVKLLPWICGLRLIELDEKVGDGERN